MSLDFVNVCEVLAKPGEREQRRFLSGVSSMGLAGENLLIGALGENPRTSVRRWLLEGLCSFKSDLSDRLIRDSFQDEHMSVRLHVIYGVVENRRMEYIPEIVKLMQDANPAVRLRALSGLVNLGYVDILPLLTRASFDEKDYVRMFASKAIKRLTR